MPFTNISSLVESDTFQTLFNKNNEMVTRLNALNTADLFAGTGITLTSVDSAGGVTLSIDFSEIDNIGFKVTESIPSGLAIGYPIGITGNGITFGAVSNLTVASSRRFLGFISESYADGYRITTSGRIAKRVDLTDNTLYYLGDGDITSTLPTTVGRVIKPVLFSVGITYGAIVLDQKESLISESTSYIKSSSRNISEITTNGNLVVGNTVYYDVAGTTWAKSRADLAHTSEVFGIIESITGITASVVTHGSVKVPAGMLNDMGSNGGSGGNDIWFLSGLTAGHLQNLAPTTNRHIIKPVYYAYPHEQSGVTFSGTIVNYIGYSVVSDSITDPAVPIGSAYARIQYVDPEGSSTDSIWIGGQYFYNTTKMSDAGFDDDDLIDWTSTIGDNRLSYVGTETISNQHRSIANAEKYNIVKNNLSLNGNGYIAVFTGFNTTNISVGSRITLSSVDVGVVVYISGTSTSSTLVVYIKPSEETGVVFGTTNIPASTTVLTIASENRVLLITDGNILVHIMPKYHIGDRPPGPYWYLRLA